MEKNYSFYRCYLERGVASEGPGLLAATEVVQAVCDAGFQRNGFNMRSFPSSPHCYYKYAKLPKQGMYMLWAVKKTDMTTLDILIDTRLYPCFVMIENNTDWQAEAEEVKDTLEQIINDDACKYKWNANLQLYNANTTQHLDEFTSALSYMKDTEVENHTNKIEQMTEDPKMKIIQELTKGNVKIGQFIMEVKGNNTYNEQPRTEERVEVTDEQIAKAIMAVNGEKKPLNEKQLFLGVLCVLISKYGWNSKWMTCCSRINDLPMNDQFEKPCDYNSIKALTAYRFANTDYKDWDKYEPSERERIIFRKCKSVADAFDRALTMQNE